MSSVLPARRAKVAAFALFIATALAALPDSDRHIIVTEGTDMQVTVSHDHKTILADIQGTDSPLDIPATRLHLNLRAQVKYGLQPWQALETATSLPARAYGLDKDLGTLEPGKLADLIIVEGDPLTNIDDVARVQCVMKDGDLQSVDQIAAPFTTLPKNNVCSTER